ncbi:hypothetical protein NPIL_79761 [Nephila pilipes]|uniref:Uncharacterized protein n=1 Tax=Nephila pilipes TaxID=299642 RepID=A0A8X6P2A5_NEPPI|nr:hypothetical protein NPIL_79761 [Nephila pilipes]
MLHSLTSNRKHKNQPNTVKRRTALQSSSQFGLVIKSLMNTFTPYIYYFVFNLTTRKFHEGASPYCLQPQHGADVLFSSPPSSCPQASTSVQPHIVSFNTPCPLQKAPLFFPALAG